MSIEAILEDYLDLERDDLIGLFTAHLDAIVAAFGESAFIELRPTRLIIHADRDKPSDN